MYKKSFISILVLSTIFLSCKEEASSNMEEEEAVELLCLGDPTYVSFQSQIDEASDGDTIMVAPGTYKGVVDFKGKNVVVGSMFLNGQDSSYIGETIIDGNGSGPVVTFANDEGSGAVLSGFTITGGSAEKGGGIYVKNASPNLENLFITRNKTVNCEVGDYFGNGQGGGIFLESSESKLYNVLVDSNISAIEGGGIFAKNSTVELRNVTVRFNTGVNYGGGIYFASTKGDFYQTAITFNTSERGGGAFLSAFTSLDYENVVVGSNDASIEGGGLYMQSSDIKGVNITMVGNDAAEFGGGGYLNGGNIDLLNSIVYGNSDQKYLDSPGGSSVTAKYTTFEGGQGGVENKNAEDVIWKEGNAEFDPITQGDFCIENPGWNKATFFKSEAIDAGDPSSKYNDPEWRFCVEGKVSAFVDSSLGIWSTVDSNYVRNDMGAFGGPGGNWTPVNTNAVGLGLSEDAINFIFE